MESIDSTLPSDLMRSVNQSRDKGASSWLMLNKQEFRDSLRLRYDMPLSDLQSKRVCSEKYTVCHALSCKKGGFVAQRHNYLINLLVRFAKTLKSNHNYNLSIMNDSTSEPR